MRRALIALSSSAPLNGLAIAIRAYGATRGVLASTLTPHSSSGIMGASPAADTQRFAFDVTDLPPRIQSELDHTASSALLRHLTRISMNHNAAPLRLKRDSRWTVGWKCRDCSATWTSRVAERCDNRVAAHFGCPSCAAGQADVTGGQAQAKLVDSFPELAVDWNTDANCDPRYRIHEDVETVVTSSPVKVWWHCQCCKRTWREAVFARVQRYLKQKGTTKASKIGNGCPRCDDIMNHAHGKKSQPALTTEDSLSQHPYLMSEAIFASGQNPTTMPLSGSNLMLWKCSYCTEDYKASIADRFLRAVHCPSCTGGKIVPPRVSQAPPVNAIAVSRPDVCREIADRRLSPLAIRYLSPTDPRVVRFVCRTCLEPYQMTMHVRCLTPEGLSACPKCKSATQRAMRDHHASGEAPRTAASASRKKRKTADSMAIVQSKLDRLGALPN